MTLLLIHNHIYPLILPLKSSLSQVTFYFVSSRALLFIIANLSYKSEFPIIFKQVEMIEYLSKQISDK